MHLRKYIQGNGKLEAQRLDFRPPVPGQADARREGHTGRVGE